MTTTANTHTRGANGPQWFDENNCKLEDFVAVVSQETRLEDYAYADAVEQNVLIYGNRLRNYIDTPDERADVQAELIRALSTGPGIVVFKGAFGDTAVVDRATEAFNDDHRRAEGIRCRGGRPLRQARRQRPRLGRPGQVCRPGTRSRSPTTTPTTSLP